MTKEEADLWNKLVYAFMLAKKGENDILTLFTDENKSIDAIFSEEEKFAILIAIGMFIDGENQLMSVLTRAKERLMKEGKWEIEEWQNPS